MSEINNLLNNISNIKTDIKSAIESKGQNVTNLSSYPNAIRNISGGGDVPISYAQLFNIANSIYNPGIPDDSSTANFTAEDEQVCLQRALKIIRGGI